MSVQALGAELAVEAFDVAVVGGFSGAGEVKHDTLVVGPQVEVVEGAGHFMAWDNPSGLARAISAALS